MAEKKEVTRVYRYTLPDTQGNNWEFSFEAGFEWDGHDNVIVRWDERSIGGGAIAIQDCGVTWKSLMIASNTFRSLAEWHSVLWNMDEERE